MLDQNWWGLNGLGSENNYLPPVVYHQCDLDFVI